MRSQMITWRSSSAAFIELGYFMGDYVVPDGYYPTEQMHATFGFAEIHASMPPELRARVVPPHRADPNNPVIFTLKKMGRTEPLVHRSQGGVVKSEQSFLIGTSDAHWLTLKYWFDPELKRVADLTERPIYDWGVEIAVPGGGLLGKSRTSVSRTGIIHCPCEWILSQRPNGFYQRDG